jgi:hypothetical protein
MKFILTILFLNLVQIIFSQSILFNEDFSSLNTGNSSGANGPSSTQWNGDVLTFPNVMNAYPAGGMVKIGNASSSGFIESKLLDLSQNNGEFVLNFDVKGWSTIEGDIKITVTGILPIIIPYTTILSSSLLETKTINFSGGIPNSTIKIETTSKRAFIDNVNVSTINLLPVEFVSFASNCENNNTVSVNWITASEHNSDYYTVEKSRDGSTWNVLKTIQAAGNSTQLINYSVADVSDINGTVYYRLSQYDIDGASKMYDIVSMNCFAEKELTLQTYPNPSNGQFTVKIENVVEGSYTLGITDLQGITIDQQMIQLETGTTVVKLNPANVQPGVYMLQFMQNGNVLQQQKLVIQ